MLREVYPHIYLNEIPLPKSPLKTLNNYIILAEDRALILDTGYDRKICKEALVAGIKEIGLDLKRAELVLTHMHVDHTGLAYFLWQEGCKVYIGEKDGKLLDNYRTSPKEIIKKLSKGFNLHRELEDREIQAYAIAAQEAFPYTSLKEGDCLEVGPYKFEIIDLPGHTPGHIGLYEREHKLFFAGDHILNEITPNIAFWHYKIDSLGNYMESLHKVRQMEIDLVLPAHRSLIRNHRERIDELLDHHEERLKEIKEILRQGRMTVLETAAQMHWDLNSGNWEEFPLTQKWFASGEAMSHLEHLVYKGEVRRLEINGDQYYELI